MNHGVLYLSNIGTNKLNQSLLGDRFGDPDAMIKGPKGDESGPKYIVHNV